MLRKCERRAWRADARACRVDSLCRTARSSARWENVRNLDVDSAAEPWYKTSCTSVDNVSLWRSSRENGNRPHHSESGRRRGRVRHRSREFCDRGIIWLRDKGFDNRSDWCCHRLRRRTGRLCDRFHSLAGGKFGISPSQGRRETMERWRLLWSYSMSIVDFFTFHVLQTEFTDEEAGNASVLLRIRGWIPSFDQFSAEDDVGWPTDVVRIVVVLQFFLRDEVLVGALREERERWKFCLLSERIDLHRRWVWKNCFAHRETGKRHCSWDCRAANRGETRADFCTWKDRDEAFVSSLSLRLRMVRLRVFV